eukprot:TRINITY_DN13385_c0_g1_i1.p1 TRINITY_DN13385_c0_g1~~TRINITY_DN13385_c0_g1_i1.p1  ORF type:complete len:409 (-),score=90.71 TRINITY_DN13385_c0_g1_i1:28-1254(-)
MGAQLRQIAQRSSEINGKRPGFCSVGVEKAVASQAEVGGAHKKRGHSRPQMSRDAVKAACVAAFHDYLALDTANHTADSFFDLVREAVAASSSKPTDSAAAGDIEMAVSGPTLAAASTATQGLQAIPGMPVRGIGYQPEFVLNRLSSDAFANWLTQLLSNQWWLFALVASAWIGSALTAFDRPDLALFPTLFSSVCLQPILMAIDQTVALNIVQMGNSPFAAFVVLLDLIALILLWAKTHYSLLVLVYSILSIGATTFLLLILEALDIPLAPLLALTPVAVAYGSSLIRFYMTGAIFSALREDVIVNVKYGSFSLNAFIGYAASVLFFLAAGKMIQILYTRFFEVPVAVPGLPPHERIPRYVHLKHRTWDVDRPFFGTPEKTKITVLWNAVLGVAVLTLFFAHEIPRL